MERRRIDCPDTEKREEIDFERTPLGVVVTGCSHFSPRCAVSCGGRCARLLDRRDRRDVEDAQPRVLVAYAGRDRFLSAIASAIAVHMTADQLTVELVDLHACTAPPPEDYDAIVIGSMLHEGEPPRAIGELVTEHRKTLDEMPSYAFVVGAMRDLGVLQETTGWKPRASAAFTPSLMGNPAELSRRFALEIAADIPTPDLVVTMAPARKRIPSKNP
jgi:hypothetical protein